MARKKASRVPSRAKATLPDESIMEADMHQESRKEKIKLLLKDFDTEVEKRVKWMEGQVQVLEESIKHIYKMDLMRFFEGTRNMLYKDYIKEKDKQTCDTVVTSTTVLDVITSADSLVKSVAKKRGRKPKVIKQEEGETAAMPPPPSTVTRTTRSSRQRVVFETSQNENMPPPGTTKTQRTMNQDQLVTPRNAAIPPHFSSHQFVTPKFDPRTPLPPGTIKRKPLLGEVAISLQGSPLQVSPQSIIPDNLEDWMAKLKANNMDESMKSKLVEFYKKVGDVINM